MEVEVESSDAEVEVEAEDEVRKPHDPTCPSPNLRIAHIRPVAIRIPVQLPRHIPQERKEAEPKNPLAQADNSMQALLLPRVRREPLRVPLLVRLVPAVVRASDGGEGVLDGRVQHVCEGVEEGEDGGDGGGDGVVDGEDGAAAGADGEGAGRGGAF